MIKMLSLALLALGVLLAPAYWVYAKFYSGSQALLVRLTQTSPLADGRPHWKSEAFTLEEDMAPAGLVLLAQGHFSPNMHESQPPRDPYAATLHRGNEAAQPLAFSLGVGNVSDSNPAFKEHLVLLHKVTPGIYRLEVDASRPPAIQIDHMQLQVRQQLHEPDPRVVTAGILIFILGMLGLVIG